MARIKIKCRTPSRENKLKLLEILSTKQVEISGFIPIHDGFVALTLNEHHADCIFNNETKRELETHGFSPIMPPQLKVKKSVILTRVDEIIYEKHIVDIGEELQKCNPWIGEDNIVDIFKFPKSSTIKITFSQTLLAEKCIDHGLKAFNISVPSYEIKQETYIQIKCCLKCYALEDHFTNECKVPKEYKVCSECSEEGHVWHQCQNNIKCCLNCKEDHSTMAMRCPRRKAIMKEKRNQTTERQKMNYANITQITPSATTMTNLQTPIVTKEEMLNIHICVAHAQNENQKKPSTYKYELNKVLKANNLPTIIIPDEVEAVGATATDETEILLKTKQVTPKLPRQNSSVCKLDSKDLGLQFYTTKDRGWPKTLPNAELVTGIQNKKYKWKYTDEKYTEEQILKKIGRGEIILSSTSCWISVDIDEYRKIRCGLVRSPQKDRDPRLSKYPHV